MDVYVPLNEKVRLFFLFTITKSEETKNNLEGQFGAHVDYTVNNRLVLRAGYRYGFSLTENRSIQGASAASGTNASAALTAEDPA